MSVSAWLSEGGTAFSSLYREAFDRLEDTQVQQTFFAYAKECQLAGMSGHAPVHEPIGCPNNLPENTLIDPMTGVVYDNQVRYFPDAFELPSIEER